MMEKLSMCRNVFVFACISMTLLMTSAQAALSSLCLDPSKYNGLHVPQGVPVLGGAEWSEPDESARDCDYYLNLELTSIDPNVEGHIFGKVLESVDCDNNDEDDDGVVRTLFFYASVAGCCSDGFSRCESEKSPCQPTPCFNGGECTTTIDEQSDDASGDDDDEDEDDDDNSGFEVSGDQQPIEVSVGYTCVCSVGFGGDHCELPSSSSCGEDVFTGCPSAHEREIKCCHAEAFIERLIFNNCAKTCCGVVCDDSISPTTSLPSSSPTTSSPSSSPTPSPTRQPSASPSTSPSTSPITSPTTSPTATPTTFAPTSSPTSSPSPSPTLSPTTSPTTSPTPSPTPSPTCPRNCGSRGTCDVDAITGDVACVSCNENKMLFNGVCLASLQCKRNQVLSGKSVGDFCSCTEDNCDYCIQTPSSTLGIIETCRVCRNGYYNYEGACYKTCPGNLLAEDRASLVGRDCFSLFPTSLPTSPPTLSPTHSPTSAPTQTPTHTPTSAPTCPKSCGNNDCEFDVNTATYKCVACGAKRVLLHGACVISAVCKRRKIASTTGGSSSELELEGRGCKCDMKHCHACVKLPTGDKCRTCKDGYYKHNGQCLENCPENFVPEPRKSLLGRDCFAAPTLSPTLSPTQLHCVDNVIVSTNTACTCADANCRACMKDNDETLSVCTSCKNKTYLEDHTCVETCQQSTYGVGLDDIGRYCLDSVFCLQGQILIDGALVANMCKCPDTVGGNRCAVCEINNGPTSATCSVCTTFTFLSKGVCVSTCPKGSISVYTADPRGLGWQCV